MEIEWDEKKNLSNADKHGLRFEDAHPVFAGHCLTFKDDRFTPRGDATRIISMRKANEREKRFYKERLGQAGRDER